MGIHGRSILPCNKVVILVVKFASLLIITYAVTTSAAVARSQAIRERFVDGIAWVGLSQQPNLLALQLRCYLQLTKEHIPKKRQNSAEEQHSCLAEALRSKIVLLVIDDCCE